MHKVGATIPNLMLGHVIYAGSQGVHKAKINKVQRNMDSKERIMGGRTELVQSVPNILFLSHFPRRTGPAPNLYT